MTAEVLLIRHGRTKGNLEGRYVGRTDEPLVPSEKEVLKLREIFEPQFLFISPMLRCRETAAVLFPECEPVVIPELAEICFGAFEYLSYQELNGRADYQAWIDSGGAAPFPGGESREEYQRRVLVGVGRMCGVLQASEKDPVRAAAVVHGGTIMALLAQLGTPRKDYFDWHVGNGCGYRVRFRFERGCKKSGASCSPDGLLLPERMIVEEKICARIGSGTD